ncbi:hypothetical protein T08_1174, partial [Trichinella sp. T8]
VRRTEGKGKYEAYLYAKWSTGKRLSSKVSGEQVSLELQNSRRQEVNQNFQKVPKGMPWA